MTTDFTTPTAATLPPELERLARRRVKARLGWYTHATVYVCVMSGLAALGWWQGRFWPIGPALGWVLGLLMHGLGVFVLGGGAGLREEMLQRERQRLQSQNHKGP
jgi:hypothetical protein